MARRLQVEQDCRAHQSRMAERAVSCGWLLKDFAESGELPLPESLPPSLTVHTLKRFGQHLLDIAAERDSHAQTNTGQHAFQKRSCRFALDCIDNVNNTFGDSVNIVFSNGSAASSSTDNSWFTPDSSSVGSSGSLDEVDCPAVGGDASHIGEPLMVTIPEDISTCDDQRSVASDGNVVYVKL